MKVLKFILLTLGGLTGLGLVITLWVVIGAQLGWQELPEGDVPQTIQIYDDRYASVSDEAFTRLEAMRRRYGIPGVTAAVAIDGELVWAAGSGWSNLETLSPATPETIFRIGSTSKAMTATMIARLTEAGTLDLDDTVSDHIAEPPNPDWADMELDQLLSHTAGFPGYENNTDYLGAIGTLRMARQYDSVAQSLELVDGSRLLYEPGEDFHYSSFDVNLAAHVAEAAAELDYANLLEREIRTPLGLQTPVLANYGEAPETVAQFYLTREGDEYKNRGAVNVSQRWPGGGLYSRSIDLVRVASAWLDDAYLTEDTRERFWTPMPIASGEINEQGYAIGWRANPESVSRFGEAAPVRIVHHGGVSRGAMSWLILYPELNMTVAVNINTQTPEFSDFASVEPELTRLFAQAAGRTPEGATLPN